MIDTPFTFEGENKGDEAMTLKKSEANKRIREINCQLPARLGYKAGAITRKLRSRYLAEQLPTVDPAKDPGLHGKSIYVSFEVDTDALEQTIRRTGGATQASIVRAAMAEALKSTPKDELQAAIEVIKAATASQDAIDEWYLKTMTEIEESHAENVALLDAAKAQRLAELDVEYNKKLGATKAPGEALKEVQNLLEQLHKS